MIESTFTFCDALTASAGVPFLIAKPGLYQSRLKHLGVYGADVVFAEEGPFRQVSFPSQSPATLLGSLSRAFRLRVLMDSMVLGLWLTSSCLCTHLVTAVSLHVRAPVPSRGGSEASAVGPSVKGAVRPIWGPSGGAPCGAGHFCKAALGGLPATLAGGRRSSGGCTVAPLGPQGSLIHVLFTCNNIK